MGEKPKVAIITTDIMGPISTGGVGTALYWQARILAQKYDVTVALLPDDPIATDAFHHWRSFYAALKIKLELIELTQQVACTSEALRSFSVLTYLKENVFDIVHFPEYRGLAYYPLLFKKTGLGFSKTQMVVQLHGPTRWHCEGGGHWLRNMREVELDFLESESIRNADVVLSPSLYLANWVAEKEWRPRNEILIQPHCLVREQFSSPQNSTPSIVHLAFVGRFEDRKGFPQFLDSLQYLDFPFKVTLYGKDGICRGQSGKQYAETVAKKLNLDLEIIEGRNHLEALRFLVQERPIVIAPSLNENSPCIVLECLLFGIPILWTNRGGTAELIADQFRGLGISDISAENLGKQIQVLRHFERSGIRQGLSPALLNSNQSFLNLHAQLLSKDPTPSISSSNQITVCIATKDRSEFLRECLESVKHQTVPVSEVIIVDDGSSPTELHRVRHLVKEFEMYFKIRLFENAESIGPSNSRNIAAAKAKSDFLFFLDDDNRLKADSVQNLTRALETSGADIISGMLEYFGAEFDSSKNEQLWLPTGPSCALGFQNNVFGDTATVFRKSIYKKLGGFKSDISIGEDWELLYRATKKGYRLLVLPTPIIEYRRHQTNRSLNPEQRLYFQIPEPTLDFLNGLSSDVKDLLMANLVQFADRTGRTTQLDPQTRNENEAEKILMQLDLLNLQDDLQFIKKDLVLHKFKTGQLVAASAGDPQFLIPLDLKGLKDAKLKIRIYSAQNSGIQVYTSQKPEGTFTEAEASIYYLTAGWNDIEFKFSQKLYGDIRFDFGMEKGLYYISELLLQNPPQEIPEYDFEANLRLVSDSTVPTDLTEVNLSKIGMEDLLLVDDKLKKFRATSNDPKLFVEIDSGFVVANWYIDIELPDETFTEIFFDVFSNSSFSASYKSDFYLKEGRNRICLSVVSRQPIKAWRFDFRNSPGDFILHHFGTLTHPVD